jgi:hypothetical protein
VEEFLEGDERVGWLFGEAENFEGCVWVAGGDGDSA